MPFDTESPGGSHACPDGEPAQQLYEQIRRHVNEQDYETWFRQTPCRFQPPQTFVFSTPNRFRKAWMKNKFGDLILRAAKLVSPVEPRVRFEVIPDPQVQAGNPTFPERQLPKAPDPVSEELLPTVPGQLPPPSRLNREFTLDNFLVGTESRLAHAAAYVVAEHPGKTYNPLFVYGSSGVGKTHLLQGISHHLAATSNLRQTYVTGEAFTNNFVHAVENHDLDSFRSNYRNTDVLILDDVHFLAAKKRTQEEFFHTFNTLLSDHRQVVLSSICSPREIQGFPKHLLSRFRWGLVVSIEPPSFETKIAFALHRAQLRAQELPAETAEYLATHVRGNLRELEGTLTHMIGLSSMNGSPLTVELAQIAIRDMSEEQSDRPHRAITIDSIFQATKNYYRLKPKELLSRSKTRTIVLARQVGMYLARELTPLSLEQIGLHFGGRDHTTVLYSCRRIRDLLPRSPQVKRDVELLRSQIQTYRR